MIDERFVFIGAVLNIIGQGSYIFDTIKGKVKPNRVTWILWAFIPAIAFYAQVKQGVGITALLTFTAGFGPLLIVGASFLNKNAVWKISKTDIYCGLISVLGIILWLITNNANLALLFSIIADASAGYPTLVKAFYFPETESDKAFFLGSISSIITLLSIKTWNFAHAAFPLYLFFICSLLVILIRFRRGSFYRAKERI